MLYRKLGEKNSSIADDNSPVVIEKNGVMQVRVCGGSQVKETAGCIIKCYEEGGKVQVRAIGASAVNQMYKALATTCYLFSQNGKTARVIPGYDEAIVWDNNKKDRVKKTVMVANIEVTE